MIIDRVSVTYGELRSSGYPSFSNTRREVTLGAQVEKGETPEQVYNELKQTAKQIIKQEFGDQIENASPMKKRLEFGVLP